jgi:RNA polymerase sigma factor (sigma-70 family)
VRQSQHGDDRARQRLIELHYGLILRLAGQFHCAGFEREDMIQEGTLGLLRALEGFDPARGCRFATYATYWIRQAIQRAIDRRGRMITLPVDLAHSIRKVDAAYDDFVSRHGYPPSLEELASGSGVSARRLGGFLACLSEPLSLDTPFDDAVDPSPRQVADPNAVDPEEAALRQLDGEEIQSWIELLPEADRVVLTGRYGLDGHEWSDAEFLTRHGLTRAEVRRIERRALRQLRSHLRRGTLEACGQPERR